MTQIHRHQGNIVSSRVDLSKFSHSQAPAVIILSDHQLSTSSVDYLRQLSPLSESSSGNYRKVYLVNTLKPVGCLEITENQCSPRAHSTCPRATLPDPCLDNPVSEHQIFAGMILPLAIIHWSIGLEVQWLGMYVG